MKVLSVIGKCIAVLIACLASVWAFGALSYDGPGAWFGALALFVVLAAMIWLKFRWRAWAVLGAWFGIVLTWWLRLEPPGAGDWQPEVAQVASAEIDGDLVTIHHVRDFDYRTETDFTPRWETRQLHLSRLTGVDIAVNYWGSPWIAHPIVSFQFSDAPPVCFSIETRKRTGQTYSAIGGLYRQFPLIYIVAEERDVLGVRAIHRKGEDVYLYHTTLTPEQARVRFLEYLTTLNSLARKPRWYNAVTTNCTTSIRSQQPGAQRLPLDWRILINGKGDEMMFERGVLRADGLAFPELKRQAHANAAIRDADGKPDFSARIRAGFSLPDNTKPLEPNE